MKPIDNRQTFYSSGKSDDDLFFLINFHPAGEPEAFICCVIKGSQ
jgi:hypothetical protein